MNTDCEAILLSWITNTSVACIGPASHWMKPTLPWDQILSTFIPPMPPPPAPAAPGLGPTSLANWALMAARPTAALPPLMLAPSTAKSLAMPSTSPLAAKSM